eukprot:5652192-Prymnesium_polylepis.2
MLLSVRATTPVRATMPVRATTLVRATTPVRATTTRRGSTCPLAARPPCGSTRAPSSRSVARPNAIRYPPTAPSVRPRCLVSGNHVRSGLRPHKQVRTDTARALCPVAVSRARARETELARDAPLPFRCNPQRFARAPALTAVPRCVPLLRRLAT